MKSLYINAHDNIELGLEPYNNLIPQDINKVIFDLDAKIDSLSNQADTADYLIAAASGIVCGILDILWVGELDLSRASEASGEKINNLVKKTADILGCKNSDELSSAVKFLEDKFPIPCDGNTPDFGGGRQHHLRDFAHHPTIVGLIFSLLTQFTGKSYGTDKKGNFLIAEVPERSKHFIGKSVPQKVIMGTVTWFFHLVSDIAGSSSTAGKSGGTGIPGPILSLAKEVSVLPVFKNIKTGDNSLSVFLSKLFNGTLMSSRDENGAIIKESVTPLDFRGELGATAILLKQTIPVIANECIVRAFYFIRRLALKIEKENILTLKEILDTDYNDIIPAKNATISRMLTISTSIFTALDLGEAIITQKYWLSVNYVGIGRFAVAIGEDINRSLKLRNVSKIKNIYEDVRRFTYRKEDNNIYERVGDSMDWGKLGLTIEQTEILYNIEYQKTLFDIENTSFPVKNADIKELKLNWLDEWKHNMTIGFSGFLQTENAQLHWFSEKELIQKIASHSPHEPWYRLVLLEAMLFEPYFPLGLEKDKNNNDIPSKKYNLLHNKINGYKKAECDNFLDKNYAAGFGHPEYVKRLRKCYNKCSRELNEVLKTVIKSISITAIAALAAVVTAGAFAPAIAVALVGSNFAGLSGAALTSACLAYLGGGAIAFGGAGMAGGTIAIVGGGAALGLGLGAGVSGAVAGTELLNKRNVILQSSKLLVAVREIFLNDENDIEFSNSIYEKYLENILEIENSISALKLQTDIAKGKQKRILKDKIKKSEETVEAMKIARKNILKFKSSFELGVNNSIQ